MSASKSIIGRKVEWRRLGEPESGVVVAGERVNAAAWLLLVMLASGELIVKSSRDVRVVRVGK